MAVSVLAAKASKQYHGRTVLAGVELRLAAGEVVALLGENGAGKSTLGKLLAGIVEADVLAGDEYIQCGANAQPRWAGWTALAAQRAGVAMVHQHGMFAPALTVLDNVMLLGAQGRPWQRLKRARVRAAFAQTAARLGWEVPLDATVASLTVGQRQRAEIVAALMGEPTVLLLDEPTALLVPSEARALLVAIRRLASQGTAVVLVTHRLDEVMLVADRALVLRAGGLVAAVPLAGEAPLAAFAEEVAHAPLAPLPSERAAQVAVLIRAMMGDSELAPLSIAPPQHERKRLRVAQLAGEGLTDVSFEIAAGEILGVAAMEGQGQAGLMLLLAGVRPARQGVVTLDGADLTVADARRRRAAGLGVVPEDRQGQGLWLDATVAVNLGLGRPDVEGEGWLQPRARAAFAQRMIHELDVRPPNVDALARELSGGNQQKLLIAREVARPDLVALLVAQPTRGVDLAAAHRIHSQLREVAAAGVAILLISADLDELMTLAHRVLVLDKGRGVGVVELRVADNAGTPSDAERQAQREQIGALMTQGQAGASL